MASPNYGPSPQTEPLESDYRDRSSHGPGHARRHRPIHGARAAHRARSRRAHRRVRLWHHHLRDDERPACLQQRLTGEPYRGHPRSRSRAAFSVQPLTPPGLDRLVRKCLAKDPEARWQNASDVADELRWIAAGSGSGSTAPPVRTPRRRSRYVSIAAGLMLAVGAVAGIWMWRQQHPSRRARGAASAGHICRQRRRGGNLARWPERRVRRGGMERRGPSARARPGWRSDAADLDRQARVCRRLGVGRLSGLGQRSAERWRRGSWHVDPASPGRQWTPAGERRQGRPHLRRTERVSR